MNTGIKKFFKNFSYSFISNLISIVLNLLILLVLPKCIDLTQYGFYQLYIFYAGYIGFMHLGWCDGIYLRYGGINYEDYDKAKFSGQFWSLIIFQLILIIVFFSVIFYMPFEINKKIILIIALISALFVIPRTMISYILQASNRIKEYAFLTGCIKLLNAIFLAIAIIMGIKNFEPLIIIDVFSNFVSLCIGIIFCKDIIFHKLESPPKILCESIENIKTGSKLMFSNIAGTLILGIQRLAIEKAWSIEVFGKISLTLNISNAIMIFINAMGVVIFPMLKRMKLSKMEELYNILRCTLMIPIFTLLVFYTPIKLFIMTWLPQYADSLKYMALLFPICIFESKMSLLINTYLKALRKEKQMLLINLLTVFISCFFTIMNVFILNNLDLTILSITMLFGLRCVIAELYLSKIINLDLKKDISYEILLCIVFMFLNWTINNVLSFILYLIAYLIYIRIKKEDIKKTLMYFKK